MDAGLSRTAAGPRRSPSVRATSDLWHHLGVPALFAALALGFKQELVFLLGALVVGAALAAAPLCRRNLRGIRLERRVPARARVGVPLALEIEVENVGAEAAVGVEVEQAQPRLCAPQEQRLEVPCLGPGRRVAGRLSVTFLARGRQTLPAPSVTSRYPLGAFRARLAVGEAQGLLVWPREGRPTAELLARLAGGGRDARPRRPRERGADDLFGVREWREGDDPRRVHGASSARRGALHVTDWRASPGHETLLVLARGAGAPQGALFERVVSIAATTWSALGRARRPARLLVGEGSVQTGPGGQAAGLDLLALARPRSAALVLRQLEHLAHRPLCRHVIVVGGAPERALHDAARAAAGAQGTAWWLDARTPGAERWVRGLEA